jgi:sterol desaturase/sphingolipid hydroxylase (fatty acid hydroxylase superfamily)
MKIPFWPIPLVLMPLGVISMVTWAIHTSTGSIWFEKYTFSCALTLIWMPAAVSLAHWSWHRFLILNALHDVHHALSPGKLCDANDLLGAGTAAPIIGGILILAFPGVGEYLGESLNSTLQGMLLGVTLYGFAILILHDGVMHARFRVPLFCKTLPLVPFLVNSHEKHHRGMRGKPYGFFDPYQKFRTCSYTAAIVHVFWFIQAWCQR